MKRDRAQLLIAFAYDGGPFHGVQPQPDRPTAGGALLTRLEQASGHEARALTLLARTDSGVHADLNLATCWLPAGTPVPVQAQDARDDGLGSVIVRSVPRSTYARGLATAKRYVYVVRDGAPQADPPWVRGTYQPTPAGGPRAWRVAATLDVERMRAGAALLLGTHDYTALRGPGGSTSYPVKTLTRLDVDRTDDRIALVLEADAFLRRMVRNVASLLVEIGAGEREPADIPDVLASRNPRRGAWPAPPQGLVLSALHLDPAGWGGAGPAGWLHHPDEVAATLAG